MADDTIPEIWLPINGFPGYEISSHGRVKSLSRFVRTRGNGLRPVRERILKPALIGPVPTRERKYFSVSLGHRKQRQVHVLVCTAFHGPRPSPAHEAAHGDGNPQNNFYKNLRWATPKENSADTIRHGRSNRGELMHTAVLTVADVLEIREVRRKGMTLKAVAREKGVHFGTIWHIDRGITWKHV